MPSNFVTVPRDILSELMSDTTEAMLPPQFQNNGTTTGRVSSSAPSLQELPRTLTATELMLQQEDAVRQLNSPRFHRPQMWFDEATSHPSLQNCTQTIRNRDGEVVGKFDFGGDKVTFEGQADVAALEFIEWVGRAFELRMREERVKGARAMLEDLKDDPRVGANARKAMAEYVEIKELYV